VSCEITFVRASTTILRLADRVVVTDPWFSMRMRFLPALVPPGIPLRDVPVPDLVLCSHLHADHFEPAAILRMAGPETVVAGPPGTATALTGLGVTRVVELVPGASREVAGLTLTPYRVPHTFPPPAENAYVVEGDGVALFFGGDGARGPIYAEVGRRHRIDVALLPVGGSLIFGRRTVMNPAQAVQAAQDLGARHLVPIHPGGEWLPLPPMSWHPGRARHAEAEARRNGLNLCVHVLQRGGTAVLPPAL